jgi:hypothetical protein
MHRVGLSSNLAEFTAIGENIRLKNNNNKSGHVRIAFLPFFYTILIIQVWTEVLHFFKMGSATKEMKLS